MATVLDWFGADVGERPSGGCALDIGCGAVRLTHAHAADVQNATGNDVSEAMLRIAREGAPANASLTGQLPPGPFDWINSYIAFQHIPPAEGLALLSRMLERAARLHQHPCHRLGRCSAPAIPARLPQTLAQPSRAKEGRPRHRRADPDARLQLQRRHACLCSARFHAAGAAPHRPWRPSRRLIHRPPRLTYLIATSVAPPARSASPANRFRSAG